MKSKNLEDFSETKIKVFNFMNKFSRLKLKKACPLRKLDIIYCSANLKLAQYILARTLSGQTFLYYLFFNKFNPEVSYFISFKSC